MTSQYALVRVGRWFSRCWVLLFAFLLASACLDTRTADVEATELDFEHSSDNGFWLPDDWEATLWAESSNFFNPTNIDVDAKGRIWVTEAVNYRGFNNSPDHRLNFEDGDRVMILEDTNGDGVCDSSKVFVQDKELVAPLGIAVIGNKVLVSCAPNLFVYTYANGDDIPNKKEVFLTGFGGFDHDHGLHSVAVGPDGKWYFNTGNAGPHHVTDKAGWTLQSGSVYKGGTPYNDSNTPAQISDDGRIWVGGLALRINSNGEGLEVLGHNFRNAYELALDSFGNMWQIDNDDQVETCRTTWIMEGGNAGYFNADGSRTWQADRKPHQDVFSAHWHQEDPGVMPAGDNTGAGSPTGVVVYEGDMFGAKYRGMLLSADAGRNTIISYQPKIDGAGFDLERKDLITSMQESTEGYVWNETDGNQRKWLRPSDIAVGTDGAIYIADWFDPVVGGHQMMDSIGYGRIYRISPKGKSLKMPIIELNTTAGQITALLNPAVNVRSLGFEKLKERGDSVLDEVVNILKSDNPYHRARAIWLLGQLGEKGVKLVEDILRNEPDSSLRVTAYRTLKANQEKIAQYASIAVDDPSPAVRREVLISLRDVNCEDSRQLNMELFQGYDGKDRWYLEALGMAMEGKEELAYRYLLPNQSENPTEWSEKFASVVWKIHPKASIAALKERAMAQNVADSLKKQAVDALAFVDDKEAVEAMMAIQLAEVDNSSGQLAAWWVDFKKNNDWLTHWDWDGNENKNSFQVSEKLKSLQTDILNDTLPILTKMEAAKQLTQSLIGGRLLLGLASDGELSKELIDAFSNVIFDSPELEIRTLAGKYFERPGGKKLSVQDITSLKRNQEIGKNIFESKCSTCHKVGETGTHIGPSLLTIGKKYDQEALLDAIINPNVDLVFVRTHVDQNKKRSNLERICAF